MKNINKGTLIAIVVLVLAMTMTACSKGGGGGTSTPTPITSGPTLTQGQQTASSSSQSASMAQGSGTTFFNLGQIGMTSSGMGAPQIKMSTVFQPSPAMKKVINVSEKFAKSRAASAAANAVRSAKLQLASAVTATGSGACGDGGYYEYDVTADSSANTFDGTIYFTSCRENDTQFDGDYNLNGSWTNTNATLTVTLGDSVNAFTMMDYGPGFSGLISKTTLTAFALNYIKTAGASSETFDIKATGVVGIHDYLSSEDYTFEYKDGFDQALDVSISAANTVLSMTTNGDFIESWVAGTTSSSVAASFQALKLDLTLTPAYEEVSLNGQFTMAFTPSTCMSGTSAFVTSTPIRASTSTGATYQGEITVNQAIKMTFNPDGTITVHYLGVDTSYSNTSELEQVCPIAESVPASTGTLTGTASAAGANLSITLTWDNAAKNGTSDSDMDLHMNYYAESAPNNTTPGTWYLDWHSASTNKTDPRYACTNPTGVDLGMNHVDVNGDGICDIGLDLENDFGDGPEHLLATKLPAGYYVISVNNNSSSDPAVLVNVSIQIGSKVFGPFTHTFTGPGDSEDVNPASWFAVADMKVDSAGNVQVKTHNQGLQLWHTDVFGMNAPALRSKKIR